MRNFQDLLLIKFQVQQIDHRYPLVWKDAVFSILEETLDILLPFRNRYAETY